jgi:hypothetical protein
MPLGLAALRNLAAAELAGTLHAIFPARGPRVIKASHDKPVVGRSFAVRWETRRAAQALLQAVQDGDSYESIVPATGTIRIPALSAGAISLSLSLLPRRVTSDTEPTVYRFPQRLESRNIGFGDTRQDTRYTTRRVLAEEQHALAAAGSCAAHRPRRPAAAARDVRRRVPASRYKR